MRSTKKSALANALQKDVAPAESIPTPSACIIDGMSLVQKAKGDHRTFAEVAASIYASVLHEYPRSNRIDVVFDVYREESIKNAERDHRATDLGTQFKNIAPGHNVQQWKKFLANPSNKKSLVHFLLKEWKQAKFREN